MKKILIGGVILIAISSLLLIGWEHTHKDSQSEKLNIEIATSQVKLNFLPFYFRPALQKIGGKNGYVFKNNSYQVSNNIASFQLINTSEEIINITEQAKPENFDTSTYTGREQLNVATGRAILGQNKNDTTAAIFGDRTMLFMKAGHVVDDDTVKAILAAFSKD